MSRLAGVGRPQAVRLAVIVVAGVAAVGYVKHTRAGSDAQQGPAAAGTPACQLLTADLAKTVLPQAKYEPDTFDDPDYCYYSEHGSKPRRGGGKLSTGRGLNLFVYSVERARVGRTTEPKSVDLRYAELVNDEVETDGIKVPATLPGDGGAVLSDLSTHDVIAIWKRDGVIYSLEYDGWGSSPKHAQAKLMKLVSALPPAS